MTASVVTKSVFVGKSAPNVACEQSICDEEICDTQWRAVATRFGARREPEQNSTVVCETWTTPTAKVCVVSVSPAWMALETDRVISRLELAGPLTPHPAIQAAVMAAAQ